MHICVCLFSRQRVPSVISWFGSKSPREVSAMGYWSRGRKKKRRERRGKKVERGRRSVRVGGADVFVFR